MEAQTNPLSKALILNKIEESYADLVRLYRTAPASWLIAPALPGDRSMKDLVGHLAAWEWRCALLLEQATTSSNPLKAEPDVDALNQEIFDERSQWSWEEVDEDSRAAHRALIKAIKNLPDERLSDPVVYNAIAVDTWDHYIKHLPDIQVWRDQLPMMKKTEG